MHVSEVMSRDVRLVKPDQTVRDAARLMAEIDAGVLPVTDGDRLVGMITDRDIVVRALGDGGGAETPVSDVMTREVKYCYEDDDLDEVSQNMADLQIRRLPVMDVNKRLVGIIAVGDVSRAVETDTAGSMIQSISEG